MIIFVAYACRIHGGRSKATATVSVGGSVLSVCLSRLTIGVLLSNRRNVVLVINQ